MRYSTQIVSGSFCGGEVEPGVFHHWYPRGLLNQERTIGGDVNTTGTGLPVDSEPTDNTRALQLQPEVQITR